MESPRGCALVPEVLKAVLLGLSAKAEPSPRTANSDLHCCRKRLSPPKPSHRDANRAGAWRVAVGPLEDSG